MSDEAYDVALGVLRGFTMGEEVGSQALSVVESQNQALQERLEAVTQERDAAASNCVWLNEQVTQAQERAEKAEAALREAGELAGHMRERYGASLARIVRTALSPTQEIDPRPDPLPYGHNPFMTARDEANEPDYLNRPTQETDPE